MRSNMMKIGKLILFAAFASLVGWGCSSGNDKGKEKEDEFKPPVADAASPHGVGPVKNVDLPAEIDQALADEGKAIYESKCAACHKFDERYVGPALGGVTERRDPAWIMNMILNPQEMTEKDPVAKKLLAEYMTQMVNQNVTETEARSILEYFRSVDKQ